jgi:Na+-translocating ferredoxin:NAD+ oxidoreductase RNF subunit RnfB
MHPRPADLYVSDFYPTIDASKCKGCKKCVALCGMEAISMSDSVAIVNRDRCIGCGVCIAACPNDAHQLLKKDKPRRPPKTHDAMYQKIMMDRVGFAGALKAVSRVLTGRKA